MKARGLHIPTLSEGLPGGGDPMAAGPVRSMSSPLYLLHWNTSTYLSLNSTIAFATASGFSSVGKCVWPGMWTGRNQGWPAE